MNTQPRFLLLISLMFLISSSIGVWVMHNLSIILVQDWTARYVEKQMLYDRARSLTPILDQTQTINELSREADLLFWASNPQNTETYADAEEILETYRRELLSRNLFIALEANRGYYFEEGQIGSFPLTAEYQLNPSNPDDRWFFSSLNSRTPMGPNVSFDRGSNSVRLWISAKLIWQSQVVGVIGTGIDLSEFLGGFLRSQEPGINTFFADQDGAIQLSVDRTMIDYSSQGKSTNEKMLIFDQIASSETRAQLEEAFSRASNNPRQVFTALMDWEGRPSTIGVSFIPELSWYEITVIDLNQVVPAERFTPFYIALFVTLILSLVVLFIGLSRWVTTPLDRLKALIDQIQNGELSETPAASRMPGEFRQLENHLREAAIDLLKYQSSLEEKVIERTAELQHLSQHDALTGLLNRRGLNDVLEQYYARWKRDKTGFSLLWIDVDKFKTLNDQLGHQAGDRALKVIAKHIKQVIRNYDHGARWGGDEFMVLLETTDPDQMEIIAARLLNIPKVYLGQDTPQLTQLGLSIGGASITERDTLDTLLIAADEALYQAKAEGRGRYIARKTD